MIARPSLLPKALTHAFEFKDHEGVSTLTADEGTDWWLEEQPGCHNHVMRTPAHLYHPQAMYEASVRLCSQAQHTQCAGLRERFLMHCVTQLP